MPKFASVRLVPSTFTSTVDPAGAVMVRLVAWARLAPEMLKTFRLELLPVKVYWLYCQVIVPFVARFPQAVEAFCRYCRAAVKSITLPWRALPLGKLTLEKVPVPA